MRPSPTAFAGWPGGARRLARDLLAERDALLTRQFDFLLRFLTPRRVVMETGSADGALSLLAAGYVERVWCIGSVEPIERCPCNLRRAALGGVPLKSIDVAFSERLDNPEEIRALLKDRGVWLLWGRAEPAAPLLQAGFTRVEYYGGKLRLPGAFARLARTPVTAAYR